MTNKQKRKQIVTLFGSYSKRLEGLYDDFIMQLSHLAIKSHVSVKNMLTESPLYHFDDYPELKQEFNNIFADYLQKEILAYRAGITSGIALAYSHDAGVLNGFSVLSDKAISHARETAAETFLRTRLNSSNGLNLSQLVWNYASQTKAEFEVAVSNVIADGLKKGISATDLGRLVRQYLNNPDMMYRRYHRTVLDAQGNKKDIVRWRRRIIDANGKVRFIEEPLEQVGMGHYRSSRKNADRLMRTEINSAYHHANYERWQTEPFVIGIRIDLSPQHPEYDMCDELQGEYPKGFLFAGWHPQCLCMSNPITIQGEEKKDFYRRLAAGEDMSGYVSPNRVKDIPDKAKAWIDANRDKFIRAGEHGTLGYVWRDNAKYWRGQFSREEQEKMGVLPQRHKRIKTEAEKADIQKRWDERKAKNALIIKTGKNVWSVADNLEYIETIQQKASLRDAILMGDTIRTAQLSKQLAKQIAGINRAARQYGEYIPNIKTHLKQLTVDELTPVYNGIVKKVGFLESKYAGDLMEQAKKYLWEAQDYLGGNMYGVQQKYVKTWKVSQEAYFALAEKTKTAYEWQKVGEALADLKAFNTKSPIIQGFINDLDILSASKQDLAKAQEIVSQAEVKKRALIREKQLRKKQNGGRNLADVSEREALKLIADFESEYGEKMDKMLRQLTEDVWAKLTSEERIVVSKYTESFNYLNKPLREIMYRDYRTWEEFEKDMPLLTKVLDKMKMPKNCVVRRGVNDFEVKGLNKWLGEVKPGDEFIDGGFLSTAVKTDAGFHEELNLVIVVPKGANGIYAEPFSHFTDEHKFSYNWQLWDGVSKEIMGSEREWIGQRGSKFRVIEKKGRTIYLQMIGQMYDQTTDYRRYFHL